MTDIIVPELLTIAATLVVRDEGDILESMLAHHLEEGVTHIFATDNASRDATRRILERCPAVVDIADSDDMTHNQEKHTTRMAREACKVKPDWVVHLDADEFWCDLHRLREHPGAAAYITRCYVHPPVRGLGPGPVPLDKMHRYLDFHGYTREFKVVHRPDPCISVKHGNHEVYGVGMAQEFLGCHRHHYPIRSYTQFERKVTQGARALQSRGFVCKRWDDWYTEFLKGDLISVYGRLCWRWDAFPEGSTPPEDEIRQVLMKGYMVDPRTVDGAFYSLREQGLRAVIGSWVPPTYKRRKLY